MKKIGKGDTGDCSVCGQKDDGAHRLFTCSKFKELRKECKFEAQDWHHLDSKRWFKSIRNNQRLQALLVTIEEESQKEYED